MKGAKAQKIRQNQKGLQYRTLHNIKCKERSLCAQLRAGTKPMQLYRQIWSYSWIAGPMCFCYLGVAKDESLLYSDLRKNIWNFQSKDPDVSQPRPDSFTMQFLTNRKCMEIETENTVSSIIGCSSHRKRKFWHVLFLNLCICVWRFSYANLIVVRDLLSPFRLGTVWCRKL